MSTDGSHNTFIDKRGRGFRIEPGGFRDSPRLLHMYLYDTPIKISQGLPPEGEPACRAWIDGLMRHGVNILARQGERVVGHAALMPDMNYEDAEYLIFICQPYRGQGLGTELTRIALATAREMGLGRIWLTVEGHNFRAIRLYRKFEFIFRDDGGWERMMVLDL